MKKILRRLLVALMGLLVVQGAVAECDPLRVNLPDDRIIDTVSAEAVGMDCQFKTPNLYDYYKEVYGGVYMWGGDTLYFDNNDVIDNEWHPLYDMPYYSTVKVWVENQCGAKDTAFVSILYPSRKSVASVSMKNAKVCANDSMTLADILTADGYLERYGFISPSAFRYYINCYSVGGDVYDVYNPNDVRFDLASKSGDCFVLAIDSITGCRDSVKASIEVDTLCYKPLNPSEYVFDCPKSSKANGYFEAVEDYTVKSLGEFEAIGAKVSPELYSFAKGGKVSTFVDGDRCADSLLFIYSATVIDYDTTLQCQTYIYLSHSSLSEVVPKRYEPDVVKPCKDVFPDMVGALTSEYGEKGYTFKQYPPKGAAIEYAEQELILTVSDGCREEEFKIEEFKFIPGIHHTYFDSVCTGESLIIDFLKHDTLTYKTMFDAQDSIVWSDNFDALGTAYYDTLAKFNKDGLYTVQVTDSRTLCPKNISYKFLSINCDAVTSIDFICPKKLPKSDYFSTLMVVESMRSLSAFLDLGGKVGDRLYDYPFSDSLMVDIVLPKVCNTEIGYMVTMFVAGKELHCDGTAEFIREPSIADVSLVPDTVYPEYRGKCMMVVPDITGSVDIIYSKGSIEQGKDLKVSQYPKAKTMLETKQTGDYTERVFIEVTDVCSGAVVEKKEVLLEVPSVNSIVSISMEDTTVCLGDRKSIKELVELGGSIRFMSNGEPQVAPAACVIEVSKDGEAVDTLDFVLDNVEKSGIYKVNATEIISQCSAEVSAYVYVDSCIVPPIDTIPQDTIPNDTIPQDTIPNDTIPVVPPVPELTVTIDSITYELDTLRNVYEVVSGCLSDAFIRSKIDSVPVVYIREKAFMDCDNMRMVYLPNALEAIGDSAFFGCENLKDVFCSHEVYVKLKLKEGDTGNGYVAYYAESVDFPISTPTICSVGNSGAMVVYNMIGVKVMQTEQRDDLKSLPKGVYVVVSAKGVEKVIIR